MVVVFINNRQKLVQSAFLNNEEAILKRLQQVYGQSQKDINSKIANLQFSIGKLQEEYDWLDDNDPEKAKVKSMIQSKIYQKQYQEALKGQVDTILDDLQTKAYTNISDYLKECYDDGFVGTMFDLQGQGIPLCMPLDQEAVVRAVQLDSKISNGLYSRMGEDVSMLKKHITAQVSRGISSGMSFEQVAQQIQFKMTGTYDSPGGALARAMTIARTEGHRIQVQAGMDACYRAKEKGADVLKQWDSTMDSATRESHTKVDGEIRELDKPFSNGLMFPGDPSGGAAEVVNCRCALLQRAKWALDEAELETLKQRAEYFGLDKAETFEDYKKKYLKAAEKIAEKPKSTFIPAKTIEEATEYAQRFVSTYKSKYSGIVDYGKIDVSTANDVNAVLTEIFDAYDAPPLKNIKLMNFREKMWQQAQAEAAYGTFTGELYLNGKWYKNPKTIAAHKKEYLDLLERVRHKIPDEISRLEGEKGYTALKKRKYWEAFLNTGRTNVFDVDTKGTIVHEMGHMLDSEVFKFHKTTSTFDIKASMEKYASGISAYATSDTREYVAESFAAYWKGETDILDPELIKIFEGMRKK